MNLRSRLDRLSHHMSPRKDETEYLEPWGHLFAKSAGREISIPEDLEEARDFMASCHARVEEPAICWLGSWTKE